MDGSASSLPFPYVPISPSDVLKYEQLTHRLLQQTIADYDVYSHPFNRKINKKEWKTVKTKELLTVYRETSSRSKKQQQNSSSSSASHYDSEASSTDSVSSQDVWASDGNPNAPTILTVGSVLGTIEDLLYGLVTPDTPKMMLRATYVEDELVDGAVLNQLKKPTPTNPFQFLGVKWQVPAIKTKKYVCDFVFVEATGIYVRANGERIGYQVRHSVEIRGYDPLPDSALNLVRGHLSSCALFVQLPHGAAVDVYAVGRANPEMTKKAPDAVALAMNATGVNALWDMGLCAQNQKLMHLLRVKNFTGDASNPVQRPNMFTCGMCTKAFGKLSSVGTCQICRMQMCSRCRLMRKLNYVTRNFEIEHKTVTFCKNCLSEATDYDASDVAQQEILGGRYGPVKPENDNQEKKPEVEEVIETIEVSKEAPYSSSTVSISSRLRESMNSKTKLLDLISAETASTLMGSSSGDFSDYDSEREEDSEWTYQTIRRPPPPTTVVEIPSNERSAMASSSTYNVMPNPPTPADPPRQFTDDRQQLWMKMAALRMQAESVYQQTKRNADLHLAQNQQQTTKSGVWVLD